MKKLASLLFVIALCQVPSVFATGPDQKQLAALVEMLGSDSFSQREQAARELQNAGPAALETLRAAAKHRDSEISGRAVRLVTVIEEQVLIGKMLAGKKIRLAVKDVSVFDAIQELNKLSGYPCEIVGNTSGLTERRITLDTGEVTFWEVIEQLCEKGRLTESATTQNVPVKKGGKVYYNNIQGMPRTTVLLMDGEARRLPVCNQGSVRILAMPAERNAAGEVQLVLDVAGEHRLQDFGVIGTPFLTKIIDDQDQALAMVLPAPTADQNVSNTFVNANGNIVVVNVNVNGRLINNMPQPVIPQKSVPVRIKLGTKGARTLREVSGKMNVQALAAPELLVKVENILGAAGRSFMGKDANAIHVQTVDKQADGSYRIRLAIENPDLQDPFGGRAVRGRGNFNGNFNNNTSFISNAILSNMPKLIDTAGKECAAEILQQGADYNPAGTYVLFADLVYRPGAAPARLTLHGQRTIVFSVPFTLKNVPIS